MTSPASSKTKCSWATLKAGPADADIVSTQAGVQELPRTADDADTTQSSLDPSRKPRFSRSTKSASFDTSSSFCGVPLRFVAASQCRLRRSPDQNGFRQLLDGDISSAADVDLLRAMAVARFNVDLTSAMSSTCRNSRASPPVGHRLNTRVSRFVIAPDQRREDVRSTRRK